MRRRGRKNSENKRERKTFRNKNVNVCVCVCARCLASVLFFSNWDNSVFFFFFFLVLGCSPELFHPCCSCTSHPVASSPCLIFPGEECSWEYCFGLLSAIKQLNLFLPIELELDTFAPELFPSLFPHQSDVVNRHLISSVLSFFFFFSENGSL